MKHVVVGAGIAGVCCAEELCRLAPNDSVVLVASSTVLKGVGNVIRYSKNLEEFEVVERDLTSLPYSNLTLIHRAATSLDLQTKTLQLANNETLSYNRLVVCTGAAPKRLLAHERVLVLRDTDSVQQLCAKLPGVRRLVLVGNGGIALELVNALRDVEVVWVMKHGHIGDAFLDVDAATFLLQHLQGQWDRGHARQAAPGQAADGTPDSRRGRDDDSAPDGMPASSAKPDHATPARAAPQANGAAPGEGADRAPDSRPAASSAEPDGATSAGAVPQANSAAVADQRGTHGAAPQGTQNKHSAQSIQSGFGHAVGPRWTSFLPSGKGRAHVLLESSCEVAEIQDPQLRPKPASGHGQHQQPQQAQQAQQQQLGAESTGCSADATMSSDGAALASAAQPWPLHVRLTNGHEYDADLVISAIGVTPELGWVPAEVERDPKDGGLLVNRYMQTSVPDVYAGGDACTLRPEDIAPHWFQMRLWTQARVMGTYAAHCMTGTAESLASGFNFELFTHATRFGGLKVVFLGLYNGQKLEGEPEEDIVSYSRATEGDQPTFVRVTLVRGRMKGAVLLGETELEEVFQNLILDNIDLSSYGPALLDPRVDLEDMFD